MSRLRILLPAVAVLALAGAVRAQETPAPEPAGPVLRQFGLVGRWAADCAAPAASTNIYAVYAAGYGGDASLTYDMGDRYDPRVYDLSNAREAAEGQLLYDQENRASHARIAIALRRDGERIRVWSSTGSGGQAFVADGKMEGGVDSPWLSRC